jgi:hypothetical protein
MVLYANRLFPTQGETHHGGGVVAVYQQTNSTNHTLSSSSYTTIVDGNVTPSRQGNKFLVMCWWRPYMGNTGRLRADLRLVRERTGVDTNTLHDIDYADFRESSGQYKCAMSFFSHLDDPNTTVQCRYYLQFSCQSISGGSTFEIHANDMRFHILEIAS